MKLVIARTWDGRAARAREHATVELEGTALGMQVRVDAPFHADPAPRLPPGPCDRLWEHEVVELFLLGAGQRYLEVELGPHGHHFALELSGRRNAVRRGMALAFEVVRARARWSGLATIPWAWLPPDCRWGNAYAIHGLGSGRRHLAWVPVPGDGPDFHRLEYFAPLRVPSR